MHVPSAGKQGSGTSVKKKILILEKAAILAMFVPKCFSMWKRVSSKVFAKSQKYELIESCYDMS